MARDTERDLLEATAISADFVSERMSQSRSRRIVLMLDCCYSGAFTAGLRRRSAEAPRVDVTEPGWAIHVPIRSLWPTIAVQTLC